MGASTPKNRGAVSLILLSTLATVGGGQPCGGQEVATPELSGRVLLGGSPLGSGMVVLHHVSADVQGEIDSTAVGPDGSFRFRLPQVPDPARSDVYFASVRHAGIVYFGRPITVAVELDSIYEIQAYDTLMAPTRGAPLVVQARNLFLEQEESVWRVTDLFQVRNDEYRTLVARDDGVAWRYPLPQAAHDPQVAQADFADGGPEFAEGDLVVRQAIPPGERIFVVRYTTEDPFIEVPLPGVTEVLDILVREPAPAIETPGLTALQPVELEPGTTYRRYNAADLRDAQVRLLPGSAASVPPVRWFAVILALTLAVAGLWAVGSTSVRPVAPDTGADRRSLVYEIAGLDEDFASLAAPSPEERGAYEARRAELLRRLRAMG